MRNYRNQPSGTVDRARKLRRNATDAEKALWKALRKKLPQAKFRRQSPIGPYFADFLSFRHKLIIEVDGGQHAERAEQDAARTRYLKSQGYRVLRLWNNDVLANTDGVIEEISLSLRESEGDEPSSAQSPSPSHGATRRGALPLPRGEENQD